MNNENNKTFKVLIFAIGLAILLISPFFLEIKWLQASSIVFIMLVAVTVYCAAFLPLLFNTILSKIETKTIVGGTIYYRGFIVYLIVSAVIIYCLLKTSLTIKLCILLQLISLFALLIYIYLSFFVFTHIKNTVEYENNKKETLSLIKTSGDSLKIKLQRLNDEEINNKITNITNNIRFLSPSDNQVGREYEQKMYHIVNQLLNDNFSDVDAIKRKLNEIDELYQLRKNIL